MTNVFVSPSVLEPTVSRLGDMHDEVRDAAQDLLLSFMHPASSPSVSHFLSVHRLLSNTRVC